MRTEHTIGGHQIAVEPIESRTWSDSRGCYTMVVSAYYVYDATLPARPDDCEIIDCYTVEKVLQGRPEETWDYEAMLSQVLDAVKVSTIRAVLAKAA